MPKLLIRRASGAKIVFRFIIFLFCLFAFGVVRLNELYYADDANKFLPQVAHPLPPLEDTLRFVPHSVQQVWEKRDFLIVFGIPSLDIPIRRWRRRLQRITCWQLPEAATRHNNFSGALLPLYLLAKHPMNNLIFSPELVQEAQQWQDIIIHPMNEGRSNTKKHIHGSGYWGTEAEVGASRKTFFLFLFGLRQFPRVPYFAKGDDDIFLRVPQYLADLRLLPRKRSYWGRARTTYVYINNETEKDAVRYMLGFCYTLARDAAESFVSHKPAQRLVKLPFSDKTKSQFTAVDMDYEDLWVGRTLQEAKFSALYFFESDARFHTYSYLPNIQHLVVFHKPNETEYYRFLYYFTTYKERQKAARIVKKEENVYSMLSVL